jgi:cell division protein FtsL
MADRVLETAGGALNQGLFWRSNLASALRRRDYKGTFFGIALLSLLLFAYVWQHMLVVKLAYDVEALRAQKQSLTNQYYYLKYRMYDVDSLSKVESIARNQLGMVTPSTSQVVILPGDGTTDSPWLAWWTQAMRKGGKP